MGEEEKYYTPDISEFHIRFEYEILIDKQDTDGSGWMKILYPQDPFIGESISRVKSLEKFRVKYLDKSDIESLGWLFDECEKGCLAFIKGAWDLWYYKEYLEIESEETGTVFKGVLKNKSELKKLMIQLGIK